MKKTIALLAFALFAISLYAQNPALGVPKFKGIEITGTLDQFGAKLASQGFKFIDKLDNNALYMGRFAGVDDCFVLLAPVENSKDIAAVLVMFGISVSEYGTIHSYETWESLYGDYKRLKDLLTEKYGKPTDENEGFSEDAHTSSSYFKLHSVKEGQCEYYTQWGDDDLDKMTVKLIIGGGKSMGLDCATVALVYVNVAKSKDSRKEVLDDL